MITDPPQSADFSAEEPTDKGEKIDRSLTRAARVNADKLFFVRSTARCRIRGDKISEALVYAAGKALPPRKERDFAYTDLPDRPYPYFALRPRRNIADV